MKKQNGGEECNQLRLKQKIFKRERSKFNF